MPVLVIRHCAGGNGMNASFTIRFTTTTTTTKPKS